MFAGIAYLLLGIIYLALIVFVLVMIYRLVKATERIADVIEHYRLDRSKGKENSF